MVNNRKQDIYKVTIWGSIVNFILLIFKFVAGILGHSSAMIADAIHSLSDFITDIIVLFFIRISSKPADISHKYGHGKFETLATSFIGFVLLAVSIGIFIEGVENIIAVIKGKTLQTPGLIAFIAAIISIITKELIYQYTIYCGKKLNSQTVIANAWHHRSDSLSSIGTLVGIAGAMFLGEKWRVLDPIAAVIVSLFILKVAINTLKNSLEELMEHSLSSTEEEEIMQIILSIDGVESPHHLRTRRIGNRVAIEVHIRMNGNMTLNKAHHITTEVEQQLKLRFGENTHIGIHTEPIK